MRIDSVVINRCIDAVKYFETNPDKTHKLVMRDDNKYVDYIVEKWNWYYWEKNYVYRDGSVYWFKFGNDIIDEKSKG